MPKVNARYVDTPACFGRLVVPLKSPTGPSGRVGNNSEDAVNDRSYSDLVVPLSCCDPDYGKTFTESLILAQDERWRRA